MTYIFRKSVSARKEGGELVFQTMLKSTAMLLALLFLFTPILQAVAAEPTRETVETSIAPERDVSSKVLLETPSFKDDIALPAERQPAAKEAETKKDEIPQLDQKLPAVDEADTKIDVEKPTIEKVGPPVMSLMGGGGPIVPEPQIQTNAPYSVALRSQSDVDQKSGAMGYTYPLDLPPGRNGLTPQLALTYSSNIHNLDQTLFGNGWGISIPRIERMTRQGVNNVFADRFQSSLSGDLSFLGGTEYGARVEQGDFNKYTFSGNIWTAETKAGTVYTYGATTAERMTDTSGNIYAWYISSIQDANGNSITFQYYKDQGQVYPDTITYTNAPGLSGIFSVTFNRESRPVAATSYRTGFLVTTAYRISSIEARAQSVLRKKYDLAYSLGSNTSTPLLHGITETSYSASGASLALPMTTFDYQTHASVWAQNTNSGKWVYPTLSNDNQTGIGVEYADVNGDGLTDIVTSRFHWEDYAWNGSSYVPNVPNPVPYEFHTFINTSSTWVENSVWNLPVPFRDEMNRDYGMRLVDINGDGLLDVLCSGPNKWIGDTSTGSYSTWQYVFRNTGSGWTRDQSLYIPAPIVKGDHSTNGTRFVDVNGDGLSDMLVSDRTNDYGVAQNNYAYLNLDGGVNWSSGQTNWAYPAPVQPWLAPNQSVWLTTPNVFFVDLNGDGLQDILWESVYNNSYQVVTGRYTRAYINNGNGWTHDDAYASPRMLTMAAYYYDPGTGQLPVSQGSGIADINGDGLTDIIQTEITTYGSGSSMTSSTVDTILLNTGNGWSSTTTNLQIHLVKPVGFLIGTPPHADMSFDKGVRVADFDGDGLGDIIKQADVGASLPSEIYLNTPGSADLLTRLRLPTGATTDIEYKPAGWHLSTTGTLLNADMPSAQVQTVSKMTTKDGATVTSQRTYAYERGREYYDSALPWDRVFAGFGKVTESSASSVHLTYLHQGDASNSSQGEYADSFSKIGMPYREEVRDVSGRLYKATVTKWSSSNLSVAGSETRGRYNVSSPQSLDLMYTSTSSHRDAAVGRQFDTSGNVTQQTQYGEVTGNDDGTFTDIGSDQRITVYDFATFVTTTRMSSYPYQITESGATGTSSRTTLLYDAVATGTVQNGNVTKRVQGDSAGTIAATTRWTYDTTGLPLTMADPRGATSTYAYDSPKLYVSTTTNALAQTTGASWDYASGAPTRIQDVNGAVRRAVYDPLGRLVDQYGPSPSGGEVLLTHLDYIDTPGSLTLTRTETVDTANSAIYKTYFDSLGREVQSRRTWPEDTVTKDTSYDAEGHIAWSSLPYGSTGMTQTSSTAVVALRIAFTYDPLGRVATTTDALGSTVNTYNAWTTTQTDRLGRQKTFDRDAYGQLIKVTERLATIPYDTVYTYDRSGGLMRITDAQGNVRNMSYDVFGNRISAEDLHAATDTTFGIETSAYDLNGNLTTSTRPNGTVIAYTYDSLNRLVKTQTGGVPIDQYTYDACLNGKGKVCKELNSNYARAYDYDSAGNTASTTLSFGSANYTTRSAYALNGALAGYTSPDGQKITYIYTGDKIRNVYMKENGGTTTTVATIVRYHPSGQVWQVSDGGKHLPR
ncbi:MAG: toxin TcdB middle/N-terminal domain-containing protein [Patescibacteria group bacterium]